MARQALTKSAVLFALTAALLAVVDFGATFRISSEKEREMMKTIRVPTDASITDLDIREKAALVGALARPRRVGAAYDRQQLVPQAAVDNAFAKFFTKDAIDTRRKMFDALVRGTRPDKLANAKLGNLRIKISGSPHFEEWHKRFFLNFLAHCREEFIGKGGVAANFKWDTKDVPVPTCSSLQDYK